jgi:hypothetical protein
MSLSPPHLAASPSYKQLLYRFSLHPLQFQFHYFHTFVFFFHSLISPCISRPLPLFHCLRNKIFKRKSDVRHFYSNLVQMVHYSVNVAHFTLFEMNDVSGVDAIPVFKRLVFRPVEMYAYYRSIHF